MHHGAKASWSLEAQGVKASLSLEAQDALKARAFVK